MTRPSKAILRLYDINCKQHCGLGVGISERFEKNLEDQRDIQKFHENITAKVFTKAQKRKFQPILKDVLFQSLNDPSDQQIFRTGLEGMLRNYPKILSGEEKNLFMCPSGFNYDSRINPSETSIPEYLQHNTPHHCPQTRLMNLSVPRWPQL